MKQGTDDRRAIVAEAKRAVRAAESAYAERVRLARDELARAEKAHERALDGARRDRRDVTKRYEAHLASAEASLRTARTGKLLGAHGRVRLYQNRLETPDGTVPLSAAIRATVEATGQKTEKADTRELVLLLDTPQFDSVIRCQPDQMIAVRDFAANVNTAAKNADARIASYHAGVTSAEEELERARRDRDSVEQAQRRVEAVEADTAAITAARTALEEAEADTGEVERRREALLAIDPQAKLKPLAPPRAWPGVSWWRGRSRKSKAALIVLAVLVALFALGIALGSDEANEADTETTSASAAAKPPPPPPLSLAVTQPGSSPAMVRSENYTIKGFATSGSQVHINGRAVPLLATRFSLPVALKMGINEFEIDVRKEGAASKYTVIRINRRLPLLQLVIRRPAYGTTTVRQPTYTIVGLTTAGARVLVKGRAVPLEGRRFETTVELNQGRNVVPVKAQKKGFASRYTRLAIVRRLSPAEIKAERAAARQRFIDSTVSIPYEQLIKDPDRYAGTKVRYYGEILQIQESGGIGFMLLYVTDLGYDIWTNQVWVNYRGHVRGAAGDQVTVYGVVVGTKSYETQIGGSTYVPEINAKYIVE